MNEQIQKIYDQLLYFHELAFEKPYEGEEDVVELALIIRNHWKGNHDIPQHWRNRFHRIILELELTDYKLGERFMAGCN
ncbi:hypothetical protein JMA_43300 (plasmid) [Jeotgalibacillus malaysiensis]|uniref:Uncharacterized protein n=1 Tax=Jeotgalibacillus malaysiensis TaxID=1508404 RepID=A0A0B5AY93_9BACL|nr:hypothetical protein [Jeotgalibacillus malaysiensis]AJD93647.1 hypothetical protein JMA_43300 [Jeotgalibacillus malaysiensis]